MKTDYTKRKDVSNALEGLADAVDRQAEYIGDFENFHRVVMERVFGMLANAEEFKLHPLVKDHLEAIRKLGNS